MPIGQRLGETRSPAQLPTQISQPYSFRTPVGYSFQQPFTYSFRTPFTYNIQNPFTYSFRSPFTYQASFRSPSSITLDRHLHIRRQLDSLITITSDRHLHIRHLLDSLIHITSDRHLHIEIQYRLNNLILEIHNNL